MRGDNPPRDIGCELAPKCLECHPELSYCMKYENRSTTGRHGTRRTNRQLIAQQLFPKHSNQYIATYLGVSLRTVYRYLS